METSTRRDENQAQHARMLESILRHAADGICVCHNVQTALA